MGEREEIDLIIHVLKWKTGASAYKSRKYNLLTRNHKTCPEAILFEPEYSGLCAEYESL